MNIFKGFLPKWQWWANRALQQLIKELEKKPDMGIQIPKKTAQAMINSLQPGPSGYIHLSLRDLARFLKLIRL